MLVRSTVERIGPNTFVTVELLLRGSKRAGAEDEKFLEAMGTRAAKVVRSTPWSAEDANALEIASFVWGYGALVPGLEAALEGHGVGDALRIVVPPAAGYGEHDDDLVFEVARSEVPATSISVGQEFLAEDVSDAGVATGADPIHVVRVDEDAVVFDANAPLAGCVLTFDVTVRDVRPATDAEVEHAARALEAAEHSAGAAPRDPPSAPDVAAIALRRSRR